MDLLGWYDNKNNSGGQNTWLKKTEDGHEDDRKRQKYYDDKNGWLFAFAPKYQ